MQELRSEGRSEPSKNFPFSHSFPSVTDRAGELCMATANSHADAGAGVRQPAQKILFVYLIQQRSAGAGTRSTNDGVRREVAAVKDAYSRPLFRS